MTLSEPMPAALKGIQLPVRGLRNDEAECQRGSGVRPFKDSSADFLCARAA